MSEPPRDWDKELADIDKAIARHGGTPPPAPQPPAARSAGPVSRPADVRPVSRGGIVLTWFWVVLGIALAAALLLWPYDKACGLPLTFFLGAAITTAVFGILGAVSAWVHHRGVAHVLSLLVLVSAGAAAAREVLPRTGYARESLTWLCPSAPTATTPAP